MSKISFLLAAISATDYSDFDHFVISKKYSTKAEIKHRREIHRANKIKIEQAAQYTKQYEVAINQFGDITTEEFLDTFTGFDPLQAETETKIHSDEGRHLAALDYTEWIDWVAYGVVTPVKYQGACGGCYSFSAAGSIEGRRALAGYPLTEMSPQEIIDCSNNVYKNGGCNGGTMVNAFKYIDNSGLSSLGNYAYTGVTGTCRNATTTRVLNKINFAGYVNVQSKNTTALKIALQSGPVSMAVNASPLQYYKSGVVPTLNCTHGTVTHAVLLVGYGFDLALNVSYWRIKNSYGSAWGENGYFRIAINQSDDVNGGPCSMLQYSSYPLIN